MRFELSFENNMLARHRYTRWHATIAAAEQEVERVYRQLDASNTPHPRYEVCDGDGRAVSSTLIKAIKS
jgi:hypothetical protein